MKNLSRIACTRIVAITIPLLLISACGDTVTEQINANVGAVKTSDDLPECTEDIAGQTAFIKETHEFLGCDGKEWQTLSANTVSVGDNVCSSTSLSDGTGFEIFCNGASIGTVKNGEKGDAGKDGAPGAKGDKGDDGAPGTNGTNGTNGKDGAPGADGAGCKIQESTALTATIACGSETFTMDLTGYVDVPEACDSTDTDCATPMDDKELSGVSQKGPFVSGTDVTAYELENGRSLKQTGKTFGGKIENKDGSFNIRTVKLKSSFAYLVADGFYRNEVTGRNSSATIKLRALTNLDGRSTANINLVTHLEYDRVQRLVTKENKSVIEAKRAAEKSLFAAFNIDNSGFKGFAEDLNIFKEGDGNAALLAVSAMLQGDRNESELTALLAAFSVDLGDNGEWNDSLRRAQIADWAMKADIEGRLAKIRANVEGWKLSDSKAPAFEGYVTNYWMKELGVGDCDENNPNTLFATKNTYSSFYAKNDSAYTDGDSSLVRLICDASGETPAWRFASDTEKDVAALDNGAAEGAITNGMINTSFVYVKNGKWRRGTELDKKLKKSCVTDSIGVTGSMIVDHETKWFICSDELVYVDGEQIPVAWRTATTDEADTAGFGIPETKKDSVKQGNINKSHYYVFDNGTWRFGTDLDGALGVCDTTKLNTLANLDGLVKDPNAWYVYADDEYATVEGYRLPAKWRKATYYEMDTYGWTDSVSDGTVRAGAVNDNLTYVYEGNAWRQGTRLDAILDTGCVSSLEGTLRQLSQFRWYTCVADTADDLTWSMVWRKVADTELDETYWNYYKGKDSIGTILTAPSKKKMVWDGDELREPDEVELGFNRGCVSGMHGNVYEFETSDGRWLYSCDDTGWDPAPKFRDTRDSTLYKIVYIGGRVWMAENLNYEVPNYSSCYNDDPSNCAMYGMLYSYYGAIVACPLGWELPEKIDFERLLAQISSEEDGRAFMSKTGWKTEDGAPFSGTNSKGFNALPAGSANYDGKLYDGQYDGLGVTTGFWSKTEGSLTGYYYIFGLNSESSPYAGSDGMLFALSKLSVRCVKKLY